jgi:hypothetical protein
MGASGWQPVGVIDEYAKEKLHDALRWNRDALVWKLDGLSEYDIRRPLTATGTNLLGLVKHCAYSAARYLGEVFDRPFPDTVPRWDDDAAWTGEHWATDRETRHELVGLYQRSWAHADQTISTLPIDAPGSVPWWPSPDVKLFDVMLQQLGELIRHAGHADILREQLDGAVGQHPEGAIAASEADHASWAAYRAEIEQAARAAADQADV